jgi:hypothetical protein
MPLTRLTLKLTILPALIFAALIALIRSQPYDDSQLREFLTPPEGCPAPCFMGIQPGVTTMSEALAILEDHKWVDSVSIESGYDRGGDYYYEAYLYWYWNRDNPQTKSLDEDGGTAYIAEGSIVQVVEIPSSISLGDIQPFAGKAQEVYLAESNRIPGLYNSLIRYDANDTQVIVALFDPSDISALWNARTRMIWGEIGKHPWFDDYDWRVWIERQEQLTG